MAGKTCKAVVAGAADGAALLRQEVGAAMGMPHFIFSFFYPGKDAELEKLNEEVECMLRLSLYYYYCVV